MRISKHAGLPCAEARVYVSYNEKKNGSFDEAIRISQTRGCLTWLDNSAIRTEDLTFPLEFFVRLTGEERYYRGILLSACRADGLADNFMAGESNHRPAHWRLRDSSARPGEGFRTIFYISHLRAVPKPDELGALNPPQYPTYVSW